MYICILAVLNVVHSTLGFVVPAIFWSFLCLASHLCVKHKLRHVKVEAALFLDKNISNHVNIGFTESAGSPTNVPIVGSPFHFFTWCTSFFPWLWLVNKKLSARKARLAVRNWTSFGIWTWNLEWAKTFVIFWSQSGENDQKCWGSQIIEVFCKEMMVLQCCSLRDSFTFLKIRISTMPLTMKNPHIVICWACRRKVYSAHQPVKNCCQWNRSSNKVLFELI